MYMRCMQTIQSHYCRRKCFWEVYIIYIQILVQSFSPLAGQQMLLYWSHLCRSSLAKNTLQRYKVIQDFASCNQKDFKCQFITSHVLSFWQISTKTSPLQFFLKDGLKRFPLKLPNSILKLQFQSLHWSLAFIKISPFCKLDVSDIKGQVDGFQTRGGCLQAFPSFPSPSSSFLFWLSHQFLRRQNTNNPVPQPFFAPQPHGNAWYTGYPIYLTFAEFIVIDIASQSNQVSTKKS